LIINISYNNNIIKYSNYYNKDINDLTSSTNNILYIPISDISTDKLNFGIHIYTEPKPSIIKYNNLYYANYSILIFNLLKYLVKNNNKFNNNYNKFKILNNPLIYNCNFTKLYDLDYFNKQFLNIISELSKISTRTLYDDSTSKMKLFIENKNIYNIDKKTTYFDVINNITNKFLNYKKNKLNECILINEHTNIIFKDDIDNVIKYYEDLEYILYECDKVNNYYILQYTFIFYKYINTFCINYNNDLPIDINYTCTQLYNIINLSNGKYIIINEDINLQIENDKFIPVCNTFDNIFDTIHKNEKFINIIDNYVKDIFEVYSLANITLYSQMNNITSKAYVNLDYIKNNDIIMFDQYMSTTFNNKFDFGFFYNSKYSPVLLKILINKKNNRWLFINKYSIVNRESEILIKRNSLFIVKDISYKIIIIRNEKIDIRVITLELSDINFDKKDTTTSIYNNILLNSGFKKYDNILESSLCIKTLHYVYSNFFNKEFEDAKPDKNCKQLQVESKMNISYEDLYGNKINSIIYKPNHSLTHVVRVICWIQLLCLQNEKYNNMIEYYEYYTDQHFIMKTCIASIFMISGRESEAGHGIDINDGDCPNLGYTEKPYNRYLKKSSENFVNFVNQDEIKKLNIFTNEDINNYKDCIINYYYYYRGDIFTSDINKYISYLFTIAHANDLVRCFNEIDAIVIVLPVNKDSIFYNYEKYNHENLLINLLLKSVINI